MSDIYDNYKIIIIGKSGVGKSSILLSFINEKFIETSSTIGCDFKSKKVNIEDKIIKLSIYDTAGTEKFQSLIPSFYRNVNGAILVYDVNDNDSFLKLNFWLKELLDHVNKNKIVLMVIANKIDTLSQDELKVASQSGKKFSLLHQALFVETSAKTLKNINYLFHELARNIYKRFPKQIGNRNLNSKSSNDSLKIKDQNQNEDGFLYNWNCC